MSNPHNVTHHSIITANLTRFVRPGATAIVVGLQASKDDRKSSEASFSFVLSRGSTILQETISRGKRRKRIAMRLWYHCHRDPSTFQRSQATYGNWVPTGYSGDGGGQARTKEFNSLVLGGKDQ